MAQTIEERAHQYGCKAAGGYYKGGARGAVYQGHYNAYVEIATDQHNIDMEKLKSVLNSLMVDTRDKAAIISLMNESN